jgi:hypothetical protein
MAEDPSKLLKEYEAYLKSLTPSELAVIKNHSCSFMTVDGRHFPHLTEREDLFARLFSMERYVVDTNANWKAEAAKPSNKDRAFVLTKTLTDEQDNIHTLFFGEKTKIHNDNIFVMAIYASAPLPLMMLQKLDAYYKGTFDEEKLKAGSKPLAERLVSKDAEIMAHHNKHIANVQQQRKDILTILGYSDIADLPPKSELVAERADYVASIQNAVPECFCNFQRSMDVARWCYCVLLIDLPKIRTEFATPDNINVFGDMYLVHNALFTHSAILSNDKPLRRMASLAGIKCVKEVI